jgi:adenosylcobinamide kinase/adenosylcobinamide-phosphate guanylyltransferase
MGELVFILGPARSGKSRLAEELASQYGQDVLYLATLQPADEEMQRRVITHRASRPAHWRTLEASLDVVAALEDAAAYDACILDSLTLWVSNLLLATTPKGDAAGSTRDQSLAKVQALAAWQAQAASPLIVVSNEVGGGVVPEYALGRAFRDILGEANQALAVAADAFYYLFAGHYVEMKVLGARPVKRRPD